MQSPPSQSEPKPELSISLQSLKDSGTTAWFQISSIAAYDRVNCVMQSLSFSEDKVGA